MYKLPLFHEPDSAKVLEFIRQHAFAVLIGVADNMPVATQVPLMLEEREGKLFLAGHIKRKMDHQLAFETNPEALVLFNGPHTYVSATWYAQPNQDSTWNYMAVHVRGRLRFLDEQALADGLRKLTLHYENDNPESPTVFDNLPLEYRNKMMKAIVAFEIEVRSIDPIFKLSQNRDHQSYQNIMQHLSQQGGEASEIAKEMDKRSSQLFNK